MPKFLERLVGKDTMLIGAAKQAKRCMQANRKIYMDIVGHGHIGKLDWEDRFTKRRKSGKLRRKWERLSG